MSPSIVMLSLFMMSRSLKLELEHLLSGSICRGLFRCSSSPCGAVILGIKADALSCETDHIRHSPEHHSLR